MAIVITPNGQYVDDQTGMPIDPRALNELLPKGGANREMMTGAALTVPEMQSDIAMQNPNMGMEGEMARENIPANMDMGMDSEMRVEDISDVDKVRMLIDMGLSPKEAMEAIGREKAMEVRPEAFGATIPSEGMGALGGVPTGAMMPATMSAPMPTPRGSTNMGMPEDAIMAQRMNQVDTTGLSPEQMNMLRMGIDPFAEGMVR